MRLNPILTCVVLLCAAIGSALECSWSAIHSILPSNAGVNYVRNLPANSTFEVPDSETGYPTDPVDLPALCAVSVQVQSIGNSTYGFGLFLPRSWNGRFLAVGNGGYGGGINWQDMAPGSRYGFATMSTDTGHNSSIVDGSWAYGNPEALENWGHLAMHGSVVVAKIITAAYYSKGISFSYYAGCSTGGRQGLKEAEKYPEDFDGIIAGAPAWYTAHLSAWTLQFALYNWPNTSDHHIPPELFSVINEEAIRQCDPQDGVKDGIISDPNGCHFRPEELLCGPNVRNATEAGCLTSPQLSTLYKIYSDMLDTNQTLLTAGLNPGSESQWDYYLNASYGLPHTFGTDYIRAFLGFGKSWKFTDFNISILDIADKLDPGNATIRGDLSAFYKKGGKLLSYHGMTDAIIPMRTLPQFYSKVERILKPQGINLDSFFRFFLVPGMSHCFTSDVDAPWYFAGPNQALFLGPTVHSVPGFSDSKHDIMRSLMAWVEDGVAPTMVVATKWFNDTTQAEVLRQRPLCMWPNMAKYRGTGDVDEAGSWYCTGPS